MFLLFVSTPVQTFADVKQPKNPHAQESINWIFSPINVCAGVLLASSILTIIYSAFRYVTSKGDPVALTEAKVWLMNSGMAIILLLSYFTLMSFLTNLF